MKGMRHAGKEACIRSFWSAEVSIINPSPTAGIYIYIYVYIYIYICVCVCKNHHDILATASPPPQRMMESVASPAQSGFRCLVVKCCESSKCQSTSAERQSGGPLLIRKPYWHLGMNPKPKLSLTPHPEEPGRPGEHVNNVAVAYRTHVTSEPSPPSCDHLGSGSHSVLL